MITSFKLFEYNEQEMDKILDKIKQSGKESLTDSELSFLYTSKNPDPKGHYDAIKGILSFDLGEVKYFGEEVEVTGTITYRDEKYFGSILYHENGTWEWEFKNSNNEELDLEDEYHYQMEGMLEEIEMENIEWK